MKRKESAVRILAALLGLYAAAGMCASAAALGKTGRQLRELSKSTEELEREIREVRQALQEDKSDEAVRQRAFRSEGMVFPEDIVFFDGG